MSKNVIQKIVVAAVILYKKKFLLLQRSKQEKIFPGLWELPSGRRELLESSIEAIKREVKEETNLDVEILHPINTFEYIMENKECVKDTTQINFLVKVKGACNVKISAEHDNFAWVSKEDLKKYKVTKEIKKTILKV